MFYHLGIKSDFSPLIGFGKIEEYISKAKKMEHKVIGLSDVDYMFGAYDFVQLCNKENIIPVPGVDIILTDDEEDYRIQLFAYNKTGLYNLIRISSEAALLKELSKRNKPRTTREKLKKYSEGIIIVEGGPESYTIKQPDENKVKNYLFFLKEIFKDRVLFELRLSTKKNIDESRDIFLKYGKEMKIPYFINSHVHYANQEDNKSQEIIMADSSNSTFKETPSSIGGTRPVLDTKNNHYYSSEQDLKSMNLFSEIDFKISNKTLDIIYNNFLIKDIISIEYDPDLRPHVKPPDNMTELEYFDSLVKKGFRELRGNAPKEIQEESLKRIKHEREVIHSNDFISYFLVVRDFIIWSEENGYPVGAGRGSGAGSEIGYLLRIHKTDPIKYDLMFERFLSPGRGAVYRLDYTDNTSEETSVTTSWTVNKEHKYTHELTIGDFLEENQKTIKDIHIIYSGSPPDIDTDFHTEGRNKVMEYVKRKYGEESVANIITFGTLKPKSAVKTVGRVLDIPISAVEHLSKMLMESPDDYIDFMNVFNPYIDTLEEIEEYEFRKEEIPEELTMEIDILNKKISKYQDIVEFVKRDKRFIKVLKEALPLLNLIDHTGVHASGVVISGRPLEDAIPTMVRPNDNVSITQWNAGPVESIGLIKMDFLGLDTVDLIDSTYKLVKKRHPDITFTMDEIGRGEMNDPEVFKLFQEGRTTGIFQFGESGVTNMLMNLKPTQFDDLSMTTAIYRPGPLGMGYDKEFAKRKNEETQPVPIHEDFYGTAIEEITKNTYGMCVFQEQIMQIASRCADFNPYETDQLRKALGKKKMDLLNSFEKQFKENILKKDDFKGKNEAINILWDGIVGFGSYAFNKSHSVSYAINSYKVAYLKTYYPLEFTASALEQRMGDQQLRKSLVQDAQKSGIIIRNVSVNASADTVSILPDNSIAFPLGAIKGLQKIVIDKIGEKAPYKDFYDFLIKTSDFMTESTLLKLAISGALDDFNVTRSAVFKKAKDLIKGAKAKQSEPGFDLFSNFNSMASQVDPLRAIKLDTPEFYDPLKKELEGNSTENYLFGTPMSDIKEGKSTSTTFTGLLVDFKKRKSKRGNDLLELLILETDSGEIMKYMIFSNTKIFSQISIKDNKENISEYITPLGNPYRLKKGKSYTFEFKEQNRYGETKKEITDIKRIFFSNKGITIKGWSTAYDYISTNNILPKDLSLEAAFKATARRYSTSNNNEYIGVEYNNFVYLVPKMN